MNRNLTRSLLVAAFTSFCAGWAGAQSYGAAASDQGSTSQNVGGSDYGSSSAGFGVKKDYGILLLAHGGGNEWNRSIEDVRKAIVGKKVPIEIAFGMADPATIQAAVDRFAEQRVQKIVAVPLLISSHSEVIDQTKYVLGMRKTPSEDFMNAPHAHMMQMTIKRVQTKIPIVMTDALDDDPVVSDILLDRAKALSRDPSKEFILLVGHGPLRDVDNEVWLRTMNRLAERVVSKGHFKGAFAATLRDDSDAQTRAKADKVMRDLVRRLSRKGQVLVIPHLISAGGIERHVQDALDGTFYKWNGRTLLPDARIAQWVFDTAEKASSRPNMRQFNDSGRPLPPPEQKRLVPIESSSRGSNGY